MHGIGSRSPTQELITRRFPRPLQDSGNLGLIDLSWKSR